uniref:Uncharacterized protein n=1 Tax=Timema cristinae TaxID=61476 RepID=A0A7R9D8A5_TIMCR|nr:unnamed protein product [Timema cristinae]
MSEPGGKIADCSVLLQQMLLVGLTGSLSATSTADSLSSSFLCSAANEANSVIPPPYSCSLDELQATPGHPPFLSIPHSQPSLPSRSPSCEMPLSASLPRHNGSLHLNQSYVSGTAMSTTGSDVSSLAGVGTPGSPPRATSPTQEIRELLDKIQQLPLEETPHDLSGDCGVPTGFIIKSKWHRGSSIFFFFSGHFLPWPVDILGLFYSSSLASRLFPSGKGSGRSLYMPIDMGLPPNNNNNKGRQWLPRSAPNTPSSPFLPCPFQIEPLQSSSRGHRQTSTGRKEDDSPLLGDYCLDEEYESSQVV